MSILDMKAGPPDYWAEIGNFFLPLKYLITNDRFDAFLQNIDLPYLINAVFWIFVFLSCGFCGFQRVFQVSPSCFRATRVCVYVCACTYVCLD